MYGYEYEYDALLSLRILKYFQQQNPDAVKWLLPTGQLDLDELYVAAEAAVWEALIEDLLDNEEDEQTTYLITNPIIDQLYTAGKEHCGCYISAWQKKLQDIAEFFLLGAMHTVSDVRLSFSETAVRIYMEPAWDCFCLVTLGNIIIDLLLYCQREIRRMSADTERSADRKEAA